MSTTADRDGDWWRGQGKKGNRHRKRRQYRKRKTLRLRQLAIVDSYGRERILLEAVDGKEPSIGLFDRQDNCVLRLFLRRETEQTSDGECYSIERPVIVLHGNGKKITLSFDDDRATVTVKDETGEAELDTFLSPHVTELAFDNADGIKKLQQSNSHDAQH